MGVCANQSSVRAAGEEVLEQAVLIETAEAVFARHDSIAPGTPGKFRELLSLVEQSSPLSAAVRVRSSPRGDFRQFIGDKL